MKLTQIDRNDIVTALRSGRTTTTELSSKYGISRSHVAVVYRKETGLKLTPFKRLTPSEKEAIVAELLAKKTTVNEIAVQYGVTPSDISYTYKKQVGRPFQPQQMSKLSSQDKETILAELKAKKTTIKELANRFGLEDATIGMFFRRKTGKSFGAPHLPSKVKATIVTELQSGKVSMKELATRYGVHPDTISRNFMKVAGTALHPRKLSQTDKAAIVAALQSGTGTKELASKYDVSSSRISQVYKQETGKGLKVNKLSQTDKETIIAALQAKRATMTELAVKYGIDQSTISHLFKKMTGKSFRLRLLSQEVKISHSSSHEDIVQLITKLVQENPNRKIIFDLKKQEISLQ